MGVDAVGRMEGGRGEDATGRKVEVGDEENEEEEEGEVWMQ